MPDLVTSYRNAGFNDDEIQSYLNGQREQFKSAGFKDDEIDSYFGLPKAPSGVPDAVAARFDAGAQAQKREGGLMQTVPAFAHLLTDPAGRTKMWDAIKANPEAFAKALLMPIEEGATSMAKGMLEMGKIPGKVASGEIDLNTPEGMDQAIGLGMFIAQGRMGKLPLDGATAPGALTAGAEIARIDRDPVGNIHDTPIGRLPVSQDITDAGNVLTRGDTTPAVENKLTQLYTDRGVHPSEVAHDAQTDPTITQSMVSADPADLPPNYEAPPPTEPPKPPSPPAEPPSPEYSDAEKSILSKISIGEQTEAAPITFDKLYTNFIDKLFPLQKATEASGLELATEDNPYQRARLLTGYVGKADHFLNQSTFDFNTYENNGPSLKEILNRPMPNSNMTIAEDLNGFRAYAAASRAMELEGRGIESGFAEAGKTSAPPLVSTGLDAAKTVISEGAAKYEKPFRELVDYQNRVSAYLRDSGVLSDAGYKAMLQANKMYVPFSRIMGLDGTAPMRGGSSLQAHNPIKTIKGSARDIVDPIESIVRNTYHAIEMAERNVVGTKLVDMLQKASADLPEFPAAIEEGKVKDNPRAGAISDELADIGIKKPDELAQSLAHAAEPAKEGEVAILRDGKRETYNVDPELAQAMKGLDRQTMGFFERVLSKPASLLRAGAVMTPEFWGRHIMRDYLYAGVTSKVGNFTPMDMARGALGLITKDADYWEWLKGGGGNISVGAIDRQYLQLDLQKLTGQTGLMGRAWNVISDPNASMWDKVGAGSKLPFQAINKFLIDPLRATTMFAENISHLGAFKKAMRANEGTPDNLRSQILDAAFKSRDTAVDASRMGAAMRAYNQIFAFGNIKLQDTDIVAGAIRKNPVVTMTKIMGAITLPSVTLWAINHDDPDYQELPQWEKDFFWLVPVGSTTPSPLHVEQAQMRGEQPKSSALFYARIPKPWAMGLTFGTGPERLLEAYWRQNPDAFKDFAHNLYQASGPEFVPTAAAPIVEQFANRSTFTNRTLIPAAQEKYLPEYQYTPYTTELAKSLGKIIGAFPGISQLKMQNSGFGGTAKALSSPILMENYLRAWTGTLGVYALNAADAALRKTGALPDPVVPTPTLADIPFVKGFVARYPSATTESIQSFYDQYAISKSYFDTYSGMAKQRDFAAMQHIQDMGGDQMLVKLDGVNKTLGEHSKSISDIYRNPDIKPDEKRQLIDSYYYSMIQVAQYGNQAIREAKQAAKLPPSLNVPAAQPEPMQGGPQP